MTSKELILDRLKRAERPIACHELDIQGYSQNNLATRLSELAKEGKIQGQTRPGFHYKEWWAVQRPEFNLDEKDQYYFV